MNHFANPDRLLIVDDERITAEFLRDIASNLGFSVRIADSFERFCEAPEGFNPTAVLLDLQMPGRDGIEFLKVLAKQKSEAKVIVASGMDNRTISTAHQLGMVLGLDMAAALQKPISVQTLRQELRKVMQGSQPLTAASLAEAIEAGDIQPYFQPKVTRDKNGGWTCTEVEALARWHQADGSVVLPVNFIDLAENNGLLKPLTDSMLEQVVIQLATWNARGCKLRAAVNISPSLLGDCAFPDELEWLLKRHKVDNNQLILEVTENVVIAYTSATIEVLSRLRVKDFGLAIDDFGTGYSSLEQLYRMPFDEIKIDRSFIKRYQSNKDIRTIIEAIIMLGQKLGMTVCAEGVETQAAFEFLESTGCDKQQGYLIGKPVPAEELSTVICKDVSEYRSARAIL